MVDFSIDEEALRNKDYNLAADIYERKIKENGPTVDLYLKLGHCYAKNKNLTESVHAYCVARLLGNVSVAELDHLVTGFVEMATKQREQDNINHHPGLFECRDCLSMWQEPVTLHCGHTYCKSCISKLQRTCRDCDTNIKPLNPLLANILLSKIIENWFPDKGKVLELKKKGNHFYNMQKYDEAIIAYSQASQLAPHDHLLASNRSRAHFSAERFEKALEEADVAIKLRSNWPKGYYRRGIALCSLGRHLEACEAFIQCLSIDNNITLARTALAETMHKLLPPVPADFLKHRPSGNDPLGQTHYLSENVSSQLMRLNLLQGVNKYLRHSHSETCLSQSQEATSESKQCTAAASTAALSQSMASLHSERTSPPHTKSSANADGTSSEVTCKSLSSEEKIMSYYSVPTHVIRKEDLECSLCIRLLYEPVTTPCGHTFCRRCLHRSLDHSAQCPLCKFSLTQYLAERQYPTTDALDKILSVYFKKDYIERQHLQEEEIAAMARNIDDEEQEIPIFVCTIAYPTIRCPLHVFEPRYRLMIRQVMESGVRQFGMCVCMDENDSNFADYGCMLEVQDVQYFPDGRSVVDAVGGRRFRVLSRSTREGYNTAVVKFLRDEHVFPEEQQAVHNLHTEVLTEVRQWISSLSDQHRQRMQQHFGQIPNVEENVTSCSQGPAWMWYTTAVLPLDPRAQVAILGMTTIKQRLRAIQRVLLFVQRRRPVE